MTVERYDSIHAAEAALRDAGGNCFSSQTYGVLRAVERGFWRCLPYTALRHARYAFSCAFAIIRPFRVYAARDARGVILCAPLHCDDAGKWSVVSGEIVELDRVDFLYSERAPSELEEAFRTVLRQMAADGIARVTWHYLDAEGITISLLHAWPHQVTATVQNVRIDFPDGVEPLLRSLGRTRRGNLQKARNRLRRDNRTVSLAFFSTAGIGKDMATPEGRAMLRRCRAVYLARQESRYSHSGWMARLYFTHGSYVPLSIPGERTFLAALQIDGTIGAYMEGYVNPAHTALEAPRIAMNDTLGRYAPGRLLMMETARWLQDHSAIRTIDLCRGDERYKREVGGTPYTTVTLCAETGRLS